MKKVYKYGTGDEIPEGAVYLSTQVETESKYFYDSPDTQRPDWVITKNKLVWHYFLVEADEQGNPIDFNKLMKKHLNI